MDGMRIGYVAAVWFGLSAVVASGAAQGVAAGAKPMAFEVVSVREDKAPPSQLPVFGPTPDGYRAVNMSLILPLLTAYVPQAGGATFYTNDQVSGLPDWVQRERYDIDAKVSEADRTEWQNPAAQKTMLQAMLQAFFAERCKMVAHRETKDVAVNFLVLGKGGPKFKETDPAATHPAGVTLPFGGVLVPSSSGINLYGVSMASLATLLSTLSEKGQSMAGRPIVDKTGLTGKYDVTLKRPDTIDAGPAGMGGSDAGSAIFSALDDLGLKLDSGKATVETLVIDHIERPSAN